MAATHSQLFLEQVPKVALAIDHETIERIATMYRTLLEAAVREPDKPVPDLEILDPSAREHLVFKRNQTSVDYPRSETVSRLFERQVEATPNDVAAV